MVHCDLKNNCWSALVHLHIYHHHHHRLHSLLHHLFNIRFYYSKSTKENNFFFLVNLTIHKLIIELFFELRWVNSQSYYIPLVWQYCFEINTHLYFGVKDLQVEVKSRTNWITSSVNASVNNAALRKLVDS